MNVLRNNLVGMMLGVSLLVGCSSNSSVSSDNVSPSPNQETLDITVSILPQAYFVEKIGGDRVKVNVMVDPGSEAHVYEPKPQQLKALSDAEAYILVGAEFEKAWQDRFKSANPQMLIIDSTKGVNQIEMIEHSHGHEHEHSEETLDSHIWLSPQEVKVQAQNIYEGLVKIDPENTTKYKNNLDNFLLEIDQLDQQIRENLEPIKNRQFIVFHPAWGYFARDYNLTQIPIEVEGQEPSASELAKVIQKAKSDNIKVIFAQYQFSAKNAETIAREINGQVILIDPMERNWSDNLLKVSETFSETLK